MREYEWLILVGLCLFYIACGVAYFVWPPRGDEPFENRWM